MCEIEFQNPTGTNQSLTVDGQTVVLPPGNMSFDASSNVVGVTQSVSICRVNQAVISVDSFGNPELLASINWTCVISTGALHGAVLAFVLLKLSIFKFWGRKMVTGGELIV